MTITGKNNGSGIFVIDDPKDIPETDESILIQRYITNPYLIRRCKFDLRIYVLVTGKLILRLHIRGESYNCRISLLFKTYPNCTKTIDRSRSTEDLHL